MDDELEKIYKTKEELLKEIEELEKKKEALSKDVQDYEETKKGLEDAIAQRKIKLGEINQSIKELKEKDESKFETYKILKIGEVMKEISKEFPEILNEDVKLKVLEAWKNKFDNNNLDEKELYKQLMLAYVSVNPDKIIELFEAKKSIEKSKQEFIRQNQNIASQSSEVVETEEFTEEEKLLAQKYGTKPEDNKKN
jgi:hypothetical protein